MNNIYYGFVIVGVISVMFLGYVYFESQNINGNATAEKPKFETFDDCFGGIGFYRFCGDEINYQKLLEIEKDMKEIKQLLNKTLRGDKAD